MVVVQPGWRLCPGEMLTVLLCQQQEIYHNCPGVACKHTVKMWHLSSKWKRVEAITYLVAKVWPALLLTEELLVSWFDKQPRGCRLTKAAESLRVVVNETWVRGSSEESSFSWLLGETGWLRSVSWVFTGDAGRGRSKDLAGAETDWPKCERMRLRDVGVKANRSTRGRSNSSSVDISTTVHGSKLKDDCGRISSKPLAVLMVVLMVVRVVVVVVAAAAMDVIVGNDDFLCSGSATLGSLHEMHKFSRR